MLYGVATSTDKEALSTGPDWRLSLEQVTDVETGLMIEPVLDFYDGPVPTAITYIWFVGGVEESRESSYTAAVEDAGKEFKLVVIPKGYEAQAIEGNFIELAAPTVVEELGDINAYVDEGPWAFDAGAIVTGNLLTFAVTEPATIDAETGVGEVPAEVYEGVIVVTVSNDSGSSEISFNVAVQVRMASYSSAYSSAYERVIA